MNYTGAVWHGNETQSYNYTIEKSLSSTKLVSTSVKATTSSLILYSAQFVVQIEAYLPGTSLVKTPPLASVPGNICHACSYTSLGCIIINKYKIANSNGTYCHPPFTPVFNHPGCISLLAPKSPISLPLRVYLLSR